MEPRLTLVTLGVADLHRAIEFYRDGLGLPMDDREADSDVAFFSLGDTRLGLYPREKLAEDATVSPDGEGFAGITLAHNVRSADAVNAQLDEAVAAGATLVKPGQEVFWGGYSGYFADPDGHLWEVAWNPYWDVE
ncbi:MULTISPECIES: VOC family protein [unclassified Haladaptatus]|uniref:VOC family protein n=1 Tax=unclassified Haladaptatus TaxID=2622732 RepID=UPI0023E79559|nr:MULTISPECIES: VOC family protein [unclassified Haladaptatus]